MPERDLKDLSPEEAEALARFQEELRRMSVGDHLATMMQSLATLAVRRLGMSPETAEERDLEQAKQAIDAFKALLTVVEGGGRPKEEVDAHRQVLSQLQMGFVAVGRQPETPPVEDGTTTEEGE
jgi:hypothetical protein